MITIWKYRLEPDQYIQTIELPTGSQFLSVIEQNDEIMLYCKINSPLSEQKETHQYTVIGTGWDNDLDSDLFSRFIGTVKIRNKYVFHVFEISDLPF